MESKINASALAGTEIGSPQLASNRSAGSEAGASKATQSLVLSVKSLNEVTGRHQRGFDGEGSEGT